MCYHFLLILYTFILYTPFLTTFLNYQAEMYLEKEIIISFFIITISASNLHIPMIRLYVFLLDFLIPFLCDPDLQCRNHFFGLKYLNSLMRIRDGEKSDPGSGINIPDPQHCLGLRMKSEKTQKIPTKYLHVLPFSANFIYIYPVYTVFDHFFK
jgi:hypothetical protein